MVKKRKRFFWIVFINCDCASSTVAKNDPSRWVLGPRCPHCSKIMGPMQWKTLSKLKALNTYEALKKYKEFQNEMVL